MATIREKAKLDYNIGSSNGTPTWQELEAGTLQRIADSLEKMEKPYLKLLADTEYLSRRYKEERSEVARMARRISALQGVITKMKKAAPSLKCSKQSKK
jgi:hypothetical protein